MEAKLVNSKKGLKVKITYYDKNGILKQVKISLKKLAVGGLLTIGLGIAATKTLHSVIQEKPFEIEAPLEVESNLAQNEYFIEQQLIQYYTAYQEYTNIMNQENYDSDEMIEKRVNLVSQTRNLKKGTTLLAEEKIIQALDIENLGLTKDDISVGIIRTNEGISCISVQNKKEFGLEKSIFYTDNPPTEIIQLLNLTEQIDNYKGTGEKEAWDKEMNDFIKKGNALYQLTLDLTEKKVVIEEGKVKITEPEKTEKSM